MFDFEGKTAVVTGGGTGMGRELVRLLTSRGCGVAMCDVIEPNMLETERLCMSANHSLDAKILRVVADVSKEDQMLAFRDRVVREWNTDSIDVLFNNAGIGGGGSIINDRREDWERTFEICWYGVYYGVRTFLPMLMKSSDARIVNTSSINGLWATVGPHTPHTAYSAAKFAVRGFTEALQIDLAINAPHVKCAIVFPGHVGSQIIANSRKILEGVNSDELTADELARLRERMKILGHKDEDLTDQALRQMSDAAARLVVDTAPTSSREAAEVILDAVRRGDWRILIGEDARIVDEQVRAHPLDSYTPEFFNQYGPAFARMSEFKGAL